MTWPVTDDGLKYLFEGEVEIPINPETGVAVLILRPKGGILVGVPPVAQGDPGQPAVIDPVVNLTELAASDATPASSTWVEIAPPTLTTPGVYRETRVVHRGADGADGTTELAIGDYPGAIAGQVLTVDGSVTGFVLTTPRITECFFPGAVTNTPSGNPNFTIATVAVPARPWARRIRPKGLTVVTGEASDVRVDFVARLAGETGGNIIGRCPGIAQTERLVLSGGKAAGTADTWDTLAANTSANVYFRCERQAGTLTYTTSASTTSGISVDAVPA